VPKRLDVESFRGDAHGDECTPALLGTRLDLKPLRVRWYEKAASAPAGNPTEFIHGVKDTLSFPLGSYLGDCPCDVAVPVYAGASLATRAVARPKSR
jgi:hypothetical protein